MKAGLQTPSAVYLPMKTSYKSPTITNSKHDKDVRRDNVDVDDIHRRLGHAGKARIASTLQHAEQLGDNEQYGTEHFDCDACLLGKSKLKTSRQPQARRSRQYIQCFFLSSPSVLHKISPPFSERLFEDHDCPKGVNYGFEF
ncbi:hypothetical protein PENPOL_c001G08911 [Penicillium polonicum]|uniref:GAG-pre-integrase domain-containing protein n=1 Tax=Penicillium polonicum TaxID=60169 RepID=A0A1V6P2Q2_PENPO|nr:hypothetical protein PENPOL_c001G08911 [Penicillium polonicum]